jgi:mRNA interferase MazF
MAWIPDRADVVWVSLSPQPGHKPTGHEQAGRRPAVVISPSPYNRKTDLALMCPITSKVKGYPMEVLIPPDLPIEGAVLSDQVRSLDWKARNASFICKLPDDVMSEILGKLSTLICE